MVSESISPPPSPSLPFSPLSLNNGYSKTAGQIGPWHSCDETGICLTGNTHTSKFTFTILQCVLVFPVFRKTVSLWAVWSFLLAGATATQGDSPIKRDVMLPVASVPSHAMCTFLASAANKRSGLTPIPTATCTEASLPRICVYVIQQLVHVERRCEGA